MEKKLENPCLMNGEEVRKRFYQIMEDYHSNDKEKQQKAKEYAIKEMKGFILTVMERTYSLYMSEHFDDLLQSGYLGVLCGMKNYQPELSAPTSYFYSFIKHEMQKYIDSSVNKITEHCSKNVNKVKKSIQVFEKDNMDYTNENLSIQTGLSVKVVEETLQLMHFSNQLSMDEYEADMIDKELSFSLSPTPEQECVKKEIDRTIYETINTDLSKLQVGIIRHKFGLNCERVLSEQLLAQQHSVSKEELRRQYNRAIRILRGTPLKEFCNNTINDYEFLEDIKISHPKRKDNTDYTFLKQIGDVCLDEIVA